MHDGSKTWTVVRGMDKVWGCRCGQGDRCEYCDLGNYVLVGGHTAPPPALWHHTQAPHPPHRRVSALTRPARIRAPLPPCCNPIVPSSPSMLLQGATPSCPPPLPCCCRVRPHRALLPSPDLQGATHSASSQHFEDDFVAWEHPLDMQLTMQTAQVWIQCGRACRWDRCGSCMDDKASPSPPCPLSLPSRVPPPPSPLLLRRGGPAWSSWCTGGMTWPTRMHLWPMASALYRR